MSHDYIWKLFLNFTTEGIQNIEVEIKKYSSQNKNLIVLKAPGPGLSNAHRTGISWKKQLKKPHPNICILYIPTI